MNDTISLLMNHRSIRKYSDRPVSEEQLRAVVAAGQMASTSSNVQAYSVIAVTSPEKKQRLAALAGNQAYIVECPVFLVWCADLYRLKKRRGACGGSRDVRRFDREFHRGHGGCRFGCAECRDRGGIAWPRHCVYRRGPQLHCRVLRGIGAPDLVYPVFGMCLGYPDQEPGLRPRLPVEAVLHRDSYDPAALEEVKSYDRISSDYLSKRTHGKNSAPGRSLWPSDWRSRSGCT